MAKRYRSTPKTDHLVKILEARILQGTYVPGDKLPSERVLADELKFSRYTVRKAYQNLDHRGILYYKNRSFLVSPRIDPTTGLLNRPQKSQKNYALFFNADEIDTKLMAGIEQALRQKGAVPYSFNLQSIDSNEERFDLLSYIHVKVAGAIFLSSRLGFEKTPITKDFIQTFPLPYVILDARMEEEFPGVVDLDPEICASKIIHYIVAHHYDTVEIISPWPFLSREAELLHQISNHSREWETGAQFKVHFVDSKRKTWPQPRGKNRLTIILRRLNAHAKALQYEGDLMIIGNRNVPGAINLGYDIDKMVETALKVFGKKNSPIPDFLKVPPKIIKRIKP